eukprot:2415688-Karenia_brevis.AAC.1
MHLKDDATHAHEEEAGKDATKPDDMLVLVSPFDGIGGARRALEIFGLKPALHVRFKTDQKCVEVVEREWPDVHSLGNMAEVKEERVVELLRTKPGLKRGLVIGGAPCQPFSGLNACRKGFEDPRSDGIEGFTAL